MELIGRTILDMKIADDKKAILFITDSGDKIARADGDCCSDTWIEHIELPAMGFPAKVLSIDNIAMPDLGSPDDYEVIAYYGCKVVTNKGDILIDYRNSSNGYYGGNISWPGEDYFYGGAFGQNVSNNQWREIVE